MKYNGRKVRILSSDQNPNCKVWICFVDDPDTDLMVNWSELS